MQQPGNAYHPNEEQRIEALHDLQILDTPVEQRFENITTLLRELYEVPISALSFVDLHRQWFKSIQGDRVEQTRRCISFCQHTILQDDVMVISDARFDDRVSTSPLVTEAPGIVFYAGAPVHGSDGLPVASLCIIDRVPRTLDDREVTLLARMAQITETLLQTPRSNPAEDIMIRHAPAGSSPSLIDPLTRTWNARGIQTLLQSSLQRAKHTSERVAIAMIDLDGLGELPGAMSRPDTETLIFDYSRIAMGAIKPHDTLGRLHDATFGVVMTKVRDEGDLLERLRALQAGAEQLVRDKDDGATSLRIHAIAAFANPDAADSSYRTLSSIEAAMATLRDTPSPQAMILPTLESDRTQPHAA